MISRADCEGADQFDQVGTLMSRTVTTLGIDVIEGGEGTAPMRRAFDELSANRRRFTPVVDTEGRYLGVLTRLGALRSSIYSPALDDQGRLRIGRRSVSTATSQVAPRPCSRPARTCWWSTPRTATSAR